MLRFDDHDTLVEVKPFGVLMREEVEAFGFLMREEVEV